MGLVMVFLLVVGVLTTLWTRFVQVRRLGDSFCTVKNSLTHPTDGVSPFQAVCTALAATVGTGNIAGVAGAIALGGPGTVFWMWISAFFGMATKYAEVVLALRYRKKDDRGNWLGGPMYYIRDGLGSKTLAAVFAFFALLASLGMGNMAQVNTISSAVVEAARQYAPQLRPEPVMLFTGLAAALPVALVTMGGARRIGMVMERLVPVVAAAYVLGSAAVLAAHWQSLPGAFALIFQEAFSPRAVMGGGLWQTIRWGVSRGVFSNEAGLGSAPIAHAAAEAEPQEQGLMGIFEVFVDTIVLCTLTALTILVSGIAVPYGKSAGAPLAVTALETVFGSWAAGLMALCLTLLALATLMSWQLYGSKCANYLFGEKGERVYGLIYVGAIIMGSTMELGVVWAFSDLCNGLMALPNLTALLVLRKEIKE